MKKLVIVMALFAFVSAFAEYVMPPCMLDHMPDSIEVNWPSTYPKGVAGWTLLYDLVNDPITYGWVNYLTDPDYWDLCDIVGAYETWYSSELDDVKTLMQDLENNDYTEAGAKAKVDDIYDDLKAIDYRYLEDGYDCRALIPDTVWNNYVSQ